MRFVDRSKASVPNVLDPTNPNSRGVKETNEAINFYADPRRQGEYKKFSVYGLPEVRTALRGLFHGKCAYCESRITSTHSIEVEHYRPKGRIYCRTTDHWTPHGYYWLAADWENLLSSCINCNQRRTHELDDGTIQTLGKWSYFPLADPTKRVSAPGKLDDEEPLLLNPCVDKPSDHLLFHIDGSITPLSQKGDTSIFILALKRKGLRTARREVTTKLEMLMEMAKRKLRDIKDSTDPHQQNTAMADFKDLCKLMSDYTKPEKEYSGMATQLIKQFFTSIAADLRQVLAS